MSNYTLTSPIDTSQLNLFPTGSSFSVNIQSPSSLVSNIIFPLPATTGSTGQFLTYNPSGSTWSNPIANSTQLPINLSFAAGRVSTSTSSTFATRGNIYFFGTTVSGTPSAINAIVGGVSAAVGVRVRIFNATAGIVIALSTAVNTLANTPQIISVPITGSFPATPAILNVQIARTTSGTAEIRYLQILP